MTTVNLGVGCKLSFAFLPENVSVRLSVSSCRLSISLHSLSIAQYHKSSSVVNCPAPHEYGPGSLKNEIRSDDRS